MWMQPCLRGPVNTGYLIPSISILVAVPIIIHTFAESTLFLRKIHPVAATFSLDRFQLPLPS